MSGENELEILRRELRTEKERGIEAARKLDELTRRLGEVETSVSARISGENDPESINYKIRRLRNSTGESATSSSTPDAGTTGGELAASWTTATPSEKLELLRAVECAILAALNARTIVCNGDGTITMTLPGLPTASCT